jgi:RsiW-degrading membrane proteinase PrsW (M82 family)
MHKYSEFSWLLFLFAVIPPIILMIFIYTRDKHEREPIGLLVKCGAFGALSVIFAFLGEQLTMYLINTGLSNAHRLVGIAVTAFLGVAVVEETGKFLALRLATWKNRYFNYTFDGIVYSVFVSLGFALVENILYVVQYGTGTALLRAITAIPGHASFGVYMGYYYGLAKFYEVAGDRKKKRNYLWLGWLSATLLHGFYDFCALSGNQVLTVIFLVFIVALDIVVLVQIHTASKNDTPIYRTYQQPVYRVPFYQAYQTPYYGQVPGNQGPYQPTYLQQQYGHYVNPYANPYANPNTNPQVPGAGQRNPYANPYANSYVNPQTPAQGAGQRTGQRTGQGNPYANPYANS